MEVVEEVVTEELELLLLEVLELLEVLDVEEVELVVLVPGPTPSSLSSHAAEPTRARKPARVAS
ncbi:MAG: hypothetical protein ABR599_04535 [Gemmatimonadota bacterium]